MIFVFLGVFLYIFVSFVTFVYFVNLYLLFTYWCNHGVANHWGTSDFLNSLWNGPYILWFNSVRRLSLIWRFSSNRRSNSFRWFYSIERFTSFPRSQFTPRVLAPTLLELGIKRAANSSTWVESSHWIEMSYWIETSYRIESSNWIESSNIYIYIYTRSKTIHNIQNIQTYTK